MIRTTSARVWLGIALFIVLAPLLIMLTDPGALSREPWRELSAALGFVGMSLMGMQFIPTARLRILATVFPTDALYSFHHRAAVIGFALATLHPLLLLLGNPYTLRLFDIRSAPWSARTGVLGFGLFLLLVVSSVWRKRINITYHVWRSIHHVAAIAAAGLVIAHLFLIDHHTANPLQSAYWVVLPALWVAATVAIRVIRPMQLLRRPYRVVEVRPERREVWTLVVEPDGHAGTGFVAGQFAWLTARSSPFLYRDNPFSYSSSAEHPTRLEFTIKEVGDFTSMVPDLKPGETVYVDGPYGTFSIDDRAAPGFVMIAGGIGAAPVLSLLRTMADRRDQRPVVFIYGNSEADRITFREDLEALEQRMTLQVVHALDSPPADWTGEVGRVTGETLERYLPANRHDLHYFVCGPLPMIRSMQETLRAMGVPAAHVHTENYEMA